MMVGWSDNLSGGIKRENINAPTDANASDVRSCVPVFPYRNSIQQSYTRDPRVFSEKEKHVSLEL